MGFWLIVPGVGMGGGGVAVTEAGFICATSATITTPKANASISTPGVNASISVPNANASIRAC